MRQAWIEERQPIVAEYERLVEGGLTTRKAARQLGYSASGIHAMQASLERINVHATGRTKGERIDLGLLPCSPEHREPLTSTSLLGRNTSATCIQQPLLAHESQSNH